MPSAFTVSLWFRPAAFTLSSPSPSQGMSRDGGLQPSAIHSVLRSRRDTRYSMKRSRRPMRITCQNSSFNLSASKEK